MNALPLLTELALVCAHLLLCAGLGALLALAGFVLGGKR